MPAQMLSAAPIFASRNFFDTTAFYARFGFELVSDHGGVYLILRRGGAELHFRPVGADFAPEDNRNNAYVRVLNMARFEAECEKKVDLPLEGAPRYVPPAAQPWGMIEGHSVDADGNLVIYGAAIEHLEEPQE